VYFIKISNMKIIIYSLLILFFASCSKDDSIDIDNESNKLEISYYEEITKEYHKDKTFTIFKVSPIVEQISTNEEINLLHITASTTNDDSIIIFIVYANKVGNNVLYNNVFTFRTSRGTPYNSVIMDFQVLANNDTEFIANFTGTLKHYNQWVPELIYINISSGSISLTY
jgi:hypothetical protein